MKFASKPIAAVIAAVLISAGAGAVHAQEVLGKTKAEWLGVLQKDPKPELRKAAVIALGILGPAQKDVMPVLSKALQEDKDELVRLQVVATLGSLGKNELKDLVPTFADVLRDDKSAAVRAQTAALFAKLGDAARPALTAIEKALGDMNPQVRAAAADAIGRIGPEAKNSIPKLVPLCKDRDVAVRFAVASSIGRIGDDALFALPDLAQMLEADSSVDVRREAARSLGLLGPSAAKHAVPALAKCLLEEKEDEVRRMAALSLGKMSAGIRLAAKEILEALRKDRDKTVRLYLLRSLGSALGPDLKDYVKDLAALLPNDNDANVRLAIIQELGSLGVAAFEALPALKDAENDVVLAVREAAKAAQAQIRMVGKKDPKN